jgi:hypothetical protein
MTMAQATKLWTAMARKEFAVCRMGAKAIDATATSNAGNTSPADSDLWAILGYTGLAIACMRDPIHTYVICRQNG